MAAEQGANRSCSYAGLEGPNAKQVRSVSIESNLQLQNEKQQAREEETQEWLQKFLPKEFDRLDRDLKREGWTGFVWEKCGRLTTALERAKPEQWSDSSQIRALLEHVAKPEHRLMLQWCFGSQRSHQMFSKFADHASKKNLPAMRAWIKRSQLLCASAQQWRAVKQELIYAHVDETRNYDNEVGIIDATIMLLRGSDHHLPTTKRAVLRKDEETKNVKVSAYKPALVECYVLLALHFLYKHRNKETDNAFKEAQGLIADAWRTLGLFHQENFKGPAAHPLRHLVEKADKIIDCHNRIMIPLENEQQFVRRLWTRCNDIPNLQWSKKVDDDLAERFAKHMAL